MDRKEKIYVPGHTGMVGATLCRKLREAGFQNLSLRTRKELDLLDQRNVAEFFDRERPEYVFMVAGKTGGIYANNTYRADFLYENLMMQANILHQAFLHDVKKLIFFACSCIYPKTCAQPMDEERILTGPLEPTNEPFAIAKIAGLKMCEAYNRQYGLEFITIIPTNIYGPGQRYDPFTSLVVPSLLQRFHAAKMDQAPSVSIWGSGKPMRDFLYVDDLAEASMFLMREYEGSISLNVGTGRSCSISDLAEIVRREVGYQGDVVFDSSKPDGVSQKSQDLSKMMDLGWKSRVGLEEGIHLTYKDFLQRPSP